MKEVISGHQRQSACNQHAISMQSASSSWSLMGVPAVAAIARRQACTSALPPRVGRRSMIPVFISDRIPLPSQPRSPGPWEVPDDGGHQTSSVTLSGHQEAIEVPSASSWASSSSVETSMSACTSSLASARGPPLPAVLIGAATIQRSQPGASQTTSKSEYSTVNPSSSRFVKNSSFRSPSSRKAAS